MHARTSSGFTLIELMIVVLIVGILASIAIPNFISIQRRAQESRVKANMHTLQLVMEDFSILNNGIYATAAGSTTNDGRTLAQMCPGGVFPLNPFTMLPSVVNWNANPALGNPGELAFNPVTDNLYFLKGNGPLGDTLTLVLTTGQ